MGKAIGEVGKFPDFEFRRRKIQRRKAVQQSRSDVHRNGGVK